MHQTGRTAIAVAAGWLLCWPAWVPAAWAADVRITILDELGQEQTDETIAVFSGGRLLGTLHVDAGHTIDSFDTTVPGDTLDYALCGLLVDRDDAGTPRRHRIDNAGSVRVRDGDTLRAFNSDNTLFSLQPPDGLPTIGSGPVCEPAIS